VCVAKVNFDQFANWVGELECCYNSYVTPIWVECINGWASAVILLLGLCFESIARRLACQDFWWEVSSSLLAVFTWSFMLEDCVISINKLLFSKLQR
jgi:hypothetical protein